MRLLAAAAALAGLSACATTEGAPRAAGPVEVKLIAFNDFHGNLEPPRRNVKAPSAAGEVQVPAGGVAYLAAAIDALRAENPNHLVVSAGDMIGASPLVSNLFLDEPTIAAMNLIDIDYNAVGNHEFDRGRAELLRIKQGGCEKHTVREPCAVEPHKGAEFDFLAANTLTEDGTPLFPAYGIRSFGTGAGEVKVGVIGMTLEGTPTVVTPAGVAGLTFRNEAETANALIPELKAKGVDAIVVLIHQGAETAAGFGGDGCDKLSGDLLPILDALDPEVDLVVSGHTHRAYICDYARVNPEKPFLVTSAGDYGTMLTDIRLTVDPAQGDVVAKSAKNLIVQGEGYRSSSGEIATTDAYPIYVADAEVAALVERYVEAAEPLAARVVGKLTGPAPRTKNEAGESPLGALVADAQLAATSGPGSGAEIALMNPGGVRADLIPAADGSVTYGQLFAVQPFGNALVVKSFTGRQLKALLEQQFDSGSNSVDKPMVLQPSRGFSFGYDLSKPAGQRIVSMTLNGQPIEDDRVYRVATNGFLASGGDNFTILREGTDQVGGPQDLDALEAYIAANSPLTPPEANRVRDMTPR